MRGSHEGYWQVSPFGEVPGWLDCALARFAHCFQSMPGRGPRRGPWPDVRPGSPEVVGVRVGLGGCYKAGLWTPVKVTLRGGSEALAAASV